MPPGRQGKQAGCHLLAADPGILVQVGGVAGPDVEGAAEADGDDTGTEDYVQLGRGEFFAVGILSFLLGIGPIFVIGFCLSDT